MRYAALGAGLLVAAALYLYVLDTGFGDAAPAVAVEPVQPAIGTPAAEPGPVVATPQPVAVPPAPVLPVLSAASLLDSDSPDWLVGSLAGNANVTAIVFPQLSEQASAMNRLAAYVEKASAPRNRVLSDAELAAVIAHAGDVPETFYLGHDYRMADIASFFNQAQQQQLVLKPQEQSLLARLLAAGLLAKPAQYQASALPQALITVSRLPPADRALLQLPVHDTVLKAAILAHELSHGEYLTRPAYRQQSWHFWKSVLNEKERQKWLMLLKRMDYDAGNEDLLVNEMQALLMHTPDGRVFSAVHLLIPEAELAAQRTRFMRASQAASRSTHPAN